MMGQLKPPELREKYSKSELIKIVTEYDRLTSDLRVLNNKVRISNTSVIMDPRVDPKLLEDRENIKKRIKRLYSEKKLRHTTICGIPCDYKNEGFIGKVGRAFDDHLFNENSKITHA